MAAAGAEPREEKCTFIIPNIPLAEDLLSEQGQRLLAVLPTFLLTQAAVVAYTSMPVTSFLTRIMYPRDIFLKFTHNGQRFFLEQEYGVHFIWAVGSERD